jgi:hypothetical protein
MSVVELKGCSGCHGTVGRIEPGSRPDETFVKIESWCCERCETVVENRREESWPTDKSRVVRRLLRLSTDYDQVRESSLQVEADMVTLKLRFYPWAVMKASKRVEERRTDSTISATYSHSNSMGS